jgi:FlaA1/EpsC-like NDP-sugar epimerase
MPVNGPIRETYQETRLIVFGAGGHAKIVLATIEAEGKYEVIGLLDDDAGKQGQTFYGYEVR